MASVKKYNKATKTWDIVASGNAAGIITTIPEILEPGETSTSVDTALSRLKGNVDLLRKNVSWLAAHGGGGSGGGGGISSSIKITNGEIMTSDGLNILYATTRSVTLNYLITALKNNMKFFIEVSLDGNTLFTNIEGWSGTPGKIEIPDLNKYTSNSSHSIVVMASDADGNSAEPYILSIIESNISLTSTVASVTATIGLAYKITYRVVNKILNSDTSLIVNNITNGVSKTFDLGKFATSDPLIYDVDFFSLFTSTPSAGSSYTIEAFAQTSIDGKTVESTKVSNKVVVEDGQSLVVLVDGITTDSEVQEGATPSTYPQGGNISFSFTPYISGISIIYYAVRLTKGNIVRDVGFFDPTPENPFNENQYVQRGKQQIFSWSIAQNDDYLGDWDIILRCWSEKGTPVTDTKLRCSVVKSVHSLMAEQNPRNTRYASWNIKSDTFPSVPAAGVWVSEEPNYIPPGSTEAVMTRTNFNVYNTNGQLSGFLVEDGQYKLRLSGESYGIIDLQPFKDDIADNNNWSRLGFTFSITLKTDLHPFSDRTVFFLGNYSSDGSFSEGIKVGLEDIIWSYTDGNIKETISCKLQQNVINTLDFIVDKNNSEVKVFINGVLNAAREIKTDFTWKTASKIYLACDSDSNGNIGNFSDVEIYDLKLFRSALNDKQIVINALNARANSNLLSDGTVDFSLYNSWKSKNFFSTSEATTSTTLWDDQNSTYASINFDSLINDSNKKPPLPVVYIDCGGSGFTKAVYEAVGANPTEYTGCTFNYFDPNSSKGSAASTGELSVQIQGTSSTGYRSKNLEIMFRKELLDDNGGAIGPELFQPNETWMPESQFTLKADVVDSAHANNASIGKWINDNSDLLFDKTPPMQELEARRPVDTRDTTQVHQNVSIKHTLEGFPVILLIKFDGTDTQEMLGIYSFNLGRNAYFNMGFKFFKSFSRRIKDSSGSFQETPCPAFITAYETYKQNEKFGTIDQRQIYSYEFSENANVIIKDDGTKQMTALFMQDDLSILQHVGEFRYNGANGDNSDVSDNNVWRRLQLLFTDLASMTGEAVDKYRWNTQTKGYEPTGDSYAAQQSWSALADDLTNRLNIRNAYSYFVICTAFGLVDSLGKNMTIRSWNVGGNLTDEGMNKWWPCFYDMDTAFGLSNTGEENVPKTSYIDTFSNATTDGVNSLVITANSADGGYDTYSARLWDVLRDTRFINTGVYSGAGYDQLWETWRSVGTLLNDANYYVDNYFSIQTRNCGELLYNYDYKIKYLTRYSKDESSAASYANIEFLHGPRVEFVRDWVKKRYYFMDGVFQYSNSALIQPYNEKGAFKCGGAEGTAPVLGVKSNCPLIFTVNIGQSSAGDIRYFVDENVLTDVRLSPVSSFNTQITVNGLSQLNRLDGLKYMRFQGFMSTLRLPAFSNVDISGVKTLSSAPILFETAFINDQDFSDVRHIDLSNTSFWSGNSGVSTFTVNIEKYTKLKDLNISSSCVTSLSLPNASLSSLNITNSDVEKITLQSQPFLSTVDFTGCKKLKTVIIDSCSKIETLNLSQLGDLDSVTITGCPNLKTITCTNNPAMSVFSISNSSSIETINLSNCNNRALNIYLVGASKVKTLNLSGTTTPEPIQLAPGLNTITSLDLSSSSVSAFQYGNDPILKYKGDNVLDLSPFSLTTLKMASAGLVRYVKFDNNKSKPFPLGSNFFSGCYSLTQVFGHVSIAGTGIFNNCNDFFIRDMPSTIPTPIIPETTWYGPDTSTAAGKTEWKNNASLQTNFTIGTTVLTSVFNATAVTLYDVYYILARCKNVTHLNSLFTNCRKITTTVANSLNRDMFKNCGNVVSINAMFYGAGQMDTILYSPTHDDSGNITRYDGLLSPLKKLTDFTNFIRTGGYKYMDEYFYAPINANGDCLKITHINWSVYNEVFIRNASTYHTSIADSEKIYAKVSKLLRYLPELTYLGYFCGSTASKLDFELAEYTDEGGGVTSYCPLFYYNTKLTNIVSSFNCHGKGSLLNVFGGDTAFLRMTDHFPQRLTTITNSFIMTADGSNTVVWPIKNSMFAKIRSTISRISGNDVGNFATSTGAFAGTGIIKSYVPDHQGDLFPYDVFKGCTNLTECPAFFARMVFPQDQLVELPSTIFKDCSKLTNVSYAFYDIATKYKLTGFGFRNCKIVNAQGVFAESGNTYRKVGGIPYGLFYQETPVRKAFTGWSHTDAGSLGISENFGIDADGNWIDDKDLEKPLPATKTYEVVQNRETKTISNISSALQRFSSPDATSYEIDWGNLEYGDCGNLVAVNENYNPVEFIANPAYDPREEIPNPAYNPQNPSAEPEFIPNISRDIRRVLKNTSYDPYEEMWNHWAVDGRVGLIDIIQNSKLYQEVQSGVVTTLPPELPAEMEDPYDERICITPAQYTAKKIVMKYYCPSDLLKYCTNTNSTNVNYLFNSSGISSDSTGNYLSYGICGRIPPRLLEPVNNIVTIEGMFNSCFNVNPYAWPTEQESGIMYPPQLFATLRSLSSLRLMFAYNEIPAKVNLSSSMFINNVGLYDLDRTWNCARWYSSATDPAQIPSDLFSRNSALANIRGTFAICSVGVDGNDNASGSIYTYGRNPAKIESTLVTRERHKNITNVSYFLGGCKTTAGTVPEFWNWLNKLSLKYRTQPYYMMSKALITNSSGMPADWSIGMND